jgi:hypothetical protein
MKAFPQKYPQDPLRACFELNPIESGMDLRDYFAAKALQGLLNEAHADFNDQAISELSYSIADAMMEARK